MLPLLNNAQDIQDLTVELVVDQIRKQPALSASETVRTNMIATVSDDDGSDCLFCAFVKIVTELRRYRSLSGLRLEQVSFED
ncbi:MAG: hypothetical protein PSV13_17275 [Lacunisphaera sp.]|nr:hypothetical protein [Lacunisphaera sp.]